MNALIQKQRLLVAVQKEQRRELMVLLQLRVLRVPVPGLAQAPLQLQSGLVWADVH